MRVAHAAPHLEGVCWGLVVREDSRVGVHMGILYVLDVPDIFSVVYTFFTEIIN